MFKYFFVGSDKLLAVINGELLYQIWFFIELEEGAFFGEKS